MVIRVTRFNFIFLAAALALCVGTGCETEKQKAAKQTAQLSVHLEAFAQTPEFVSNIQIYRAEPLMLKVETAPFLTEGEIEEAKVVESLGTYSLFLKFTRKGTQILENYTATNPRRHYAVYAQFGKKKETSRWLAAPVINVRITDGVLSFTPDATREEADEIARGLNNAAIASGNQSKKKK